MTYTYAVVVNIPFVPKQHVFIIENQMDLFRQLVPTRSVLSDDVQALALMLRQVRTKRIFVVNVGVDAMPLWLMALDLFKPYVGEINRVFDMGRPYRPLHKAMVALAEHLSTEDVKCEAIMSSAYMGQNFIEADEDGKRRLQLKAVLDPDTLGG